MARSRSNPIFNQLTAAGVVTVLLGVAAVGLGLSITRQGPNAGKLSTQLEPLETGKKEHQTKLTTSAPAQEPYKTNVPNGISAISYYSDSGKLLAWFILPRSVGKHPAVLFAHRGYALDYRDCQEIVPFYNAGYAVMLPAWRGENGNPGKFEMCFGEVADAKAAIQYLKERPDIDTKHIYAAGLGTGGTLVMLLAEECPTLRKAAACSGYPDMLGGGPYDHPPFDEKNQYELDLRSPGNHARDLKCPLALFYASNDAEDTRYADQAKLMLKDAKARGKIVLIETIPNTNRANVINYAVPRMLNFFQTN